MTSRTSRRRDYNKQPLTNCQVLVATGEGREVWVLVNADSIEAAQAAALQKNRAAFKVLGVHFNCQPTVWF